MAYSDVVLADSPIAYYRLDGTVGRTVDSSGNTRTLTANGTNFTNRASLLLSDTTNGSCEFDNATATGNLTSADAAFKYTATSPFSVELWVSLNVLDATFRRLIGWTDDGAPTPTYYGIQYATSVGFYGLRVNAGVTKDTYGIPSGFGTGSTYHVVLTYDGSNLKIFANTTQLGTTTADTSSLGAFGGNFCIGAGQFGSSSAKATIDEVAVYSSALDTTKITTHYDAGRAVSSSPTIRTISTPLRW